MEKAILTFITTTVLCAMITTSYAIDSSFSDISGHWAESTISKWRDKDILSGYPDGSFKPDAPVTRAELSKIITLAFDLKEKVSLSQYNDLDSDSWYYSYVGCAAKYLPVYPLYEDIETNVPFLDNLENNKGGFLPEVESIRMHAAEALVEIKKEQENLTIELPIIQDVADDVRKMFRDETYNSLYPLNGQVPTNIERMHNYTWLAAKLGIMQGNDDGYFLPYNRLTRAELVTTIDRMLEK